jgi:hypothetical protein
MNLYTKKILLAILLFILLTTSLAFAIHTVLNQNTLGADLYDYFIAGQSVFLNHQSPYSQEVTNQIQLGIYKRLAFPWEDQYAFPYPLYSLFVLIPFYWLSFDWAHSFWMALNLLILVAAILYVLPKGPRWLAFSVIFLYPFSFGLIMGNFAILLGVLVLLTYFVCFNNQEKVPLIAQVILGFFLAWATSKPQFIWLYMLLFGLAMFKKRLWPLMISFSVSLMIFIGASFLLLPDWIYQLTNRLSAYYDYNHSWPVLTNFLRLLLLPEIASIASTVIIFTLLGISLWLGILWWKGRIAPLVIFGWCGFLTYLVHPHSAPY